MMEIGLNRMTFVDVKKLPRYVREFVKGSPSEDKPSIADIYKAGRSMGLSREDILRLYYQSNRGAGIKGFIARHWTVFLPVTVLAIFIAFVLLRNFAGSYPGSTYPAGAYYGVISPNDFKKNKLHRKNESTLDRSSEA